MNTLIIIGNGFDLANGLPTSYRHFFESLILKLIEDSRGYEDLVQPTNASKDVETFLKYGKNHTYPNKFFELLTKDFVDKNWCDIEALYFRELNNMNNFDDIHQLNKQFKRIKDELEIYLSELSEPDPGHEFFQHILNRPSTGRTIILNFNYTKTFEKYINPKKVRIINIHGELNSEENPIIFGYAATENQIKDLRKIDSEYMRNVKRTNYNFTGNYKSLLETLEYAQHDYRVIILGHSCGESDQLILSQIFNNKNVNLIEITYYNREGYFQQIVNIENLIHDENDYNKIVEFDKSLRMPQVNEKNDYEETLSHYYHNIRK